MRDGILYMTRESELMRSQDGYVCCIAKLKAQRDANQSIQICSRLLATNDRGSLSTLSIVTGLSERGNAGEPLVLWSTSLALTCAAREGTKIDWSKTSLT